MAAIAGRPIHPLLTPFPIAFLAGSVATDLAFWWTTLPWYNGSAEFWARASQWLIGVGLFSGVAAAAMGFIDFVAARRSGQASVWLHLAFGSAVLVLAAINLLLRLGDLSGAIIPWGLILSAASVVLTVLTVWHGVALVYQHLIGLSAEPEDAG